MYLRRTLCHLSAVHQAHLYFYGYPGSTAIIDNIVFGGEGGGVFTDDADAVEIKGDGTFINGNIPDDCEADIIPLLYY